MKWSNSSIELALLEQKNSRTLLTLKLQPYFPDVLVPLIINYVLLPHWSQLTQEERTRRLQDQNKDFSWCDLRGLTLRSSSEDTLGPHFFANAKFMGSDLSNLDLTSREFSHADFTDAILSNICAKDASFYNACFIRAIGLLTIQWQEVRSLHKINLQGASLRKVDFRGVDLTEADLSGSDLTGAQASGATLNWTNLSGADLTDADLKDAKVGVANLKGSNLTNTILVGATLWGMNFKAATCKGMTLSFEKLDDCSIDGRHIIYSFANIESKTEGSLSQFWRWPRERQLARQCCDEKLSLEAAQNLLTSIKEIIKEDSPDSEFLKCLKKLAALEKMSIQDENFITVLITICPGLSQIKIPPSPRLG